jgi:hyperosmotically inducible protein
LKRRKIVNTTRPIPTLLAALVGLLTLCLAGACSSTQTVGEEIDDAWITSKVTAKLTADPEVNPFEIDVDTTDGVVRLSGMVETETQRAEAAELARATEGVVRVINDIALGDSTLEENIDDSWISTKVKAKLTADPEVRKRDIDVDVLEGVVTLSGSVLSEQEREHAEALAADTTGVIRVVSRLQVASS